MTDLEKIQNDIILNEILPDLGALAYKPYRERVLYLNNWLNSRKVRAFGDDSYLKRWLLEKYKLAKEQMEIQEGGQAPSHSQPVRSEKKYTLKEIALINVYTDILITRSNATEIAKQWGYNSGDALYNQYLKFVKRADRIGADSEKIAKNKVAMLDKVIEYLRNNNPGACKMAEDERDVLAKTIGIDE